MTDRDLVAVNPRPAGSPVLRSRRPGGRLPLRPCATGGICGPTQLAAARGPQIRLLLSAGLFGADNDTPSVPHTQR